MDTTVPKTLDTSGLKKFAQAARRSLLQQVSAKLDLVLADGSAARREQPDAVKELQSQVAADGREQVIERVAYTWFNRFSGLRFMDAIGLTTIKVVSNVPGQTRPEILAEAAAGHIDEEVPAATRQKVLALLEGRSPSGDPQSEAYRLLVVAACNSWHKAMPFLFEKIADYTELLMPDDLLSTNSLLAQLRDEMTDEACGDVEIIGWLYQFYISEKKDQVFAALKKNVKITAENIPAATQLFTPHWIVRYLVENSLGRLWLLNRPASKLAEKMDYYIPPVAPETDFLRIAKPEDIRICDPACGSGHMLTYAFDLLYEIYLETGHADADIPALILTHNLTGVEIDERAGALAAFALSMKAAARLGRRRFLRMEARPNICVLDDVSFTPSEAQDVSAMVGRDLFSDELQETLQQFEQAKNFGSLIVPKLKDPSEVARVVRLKEFGSDLLLRDVQGRVLQVLEMAEALSPKYHVVAANPPYMGGKGMNGMLGEYAKAHFPDSKTDLYSTFIERIELIVRTTGYIGLMTPFTWMSLKSFEALRAKILAESWISSLIQPEYHSFFDSAFVPVCAFVLQLKRSQGRAGIYIDLSQFYGAKVQDPKALEAIRSPDCTWRVAIDQNDFEKIPSKPIAFAISERMRIAFRSEILISDIAEPRQGLATANNDKYLRNWSEIAASRFASLAKDAAVQSGCRWFPYQKGGSFRKWYGNHELAIDWQNNGASLKSDPKAVIRNPTYYLKEGMTWTSLTVSAFNGRYCPKGFVFDSKGPVLFAKDGQPLHKIMSFLNSSVSATFLKVLAPTMDFSQGPVGNVPVRSIVTNQSEYDLVRANQMIALAKSDWDSYETSWDFNTLPLLSQNHQSETLAAIYARTRTKWQSMTDELQKLEEENNSVFIDAYGLADDLGPHAPIDEITLTCNPAYRYGVKLSEDDREARLLEDTIAEFAHYAVGCMFGRYSLDEPGLILANQGEGMEAYLEKVPNPRFAPDRDNVIPILDADWFADDIVSRFREFLRVTFGEEKFKENLAFIETALGKDLRRWFTKDFYDYHVRRFKKRPFYWMFTSPKGSFSALIYMHRYRPDTVGVVLNNYLREYRRKLVSHRAQLEKQSTSAEASPAEKARALKEIERLGSVVDEIDAYERDVLFPLATQRIEIDLDDGVKANYPKFGSALKTIKGLADTDD